MKKLTTKRAITLRAVIDVIPKPKPRMTQASVWRHKTYFDWVKALRMLAPKDIDWDCLEITFIMPMAKSWSKKKKAEYDGKPHKQTPDLDNMVKAFKDALLEQDSGVWRYEKITKLWGYEGFIIVKILGGEHEL